MISMNAHRILSPLILRRQRFAAMAALDQGVGAGVPAHLRESKGMVEAAAGGSTGTDEVATTRHMAVVAGLLEQTGDFTACGLECGTSKELSGDAVNPPPNGERARTFHACAPPPMHMSSMCIKYLMLMCASACAGCEQAFEVLEKEEVEERAALLLLGGCGPPTPTGRPISPAKITNHLISVAKAVVAELFAKSRERVRRLSESTQLDKEEALAYLLADLGGHELLPDEARSIGKLANKAASAFNGIASSGKLSADGQLKHKASTARSKARAAAAKNYELGTSSYY
jgi:hypothetical protein